MEYWMASRAALAGCTSLTATSLFSFFLSEHFFLRGPWIQQQEDEICKQKQAEDWQLTVLEEPSDLLDAMRRELVEIIVVAVSGSSVQTAMILSSFSPCSPENPTTEQSYFSPEV
jgi:hypothetical protein